MALPYLRRSVLLLGLICALGMAAPLAAETVNFSDVVFGDDPYLNGPVAGGVESPDPWGAPLPIVTGNLQSGGVGFENSHNTNYQSWGGFAFSKVTDNSVGGAYNQFSAYTGGGVGGAADTYGIAYGYREAPITQVGDLGGLPNFTLPDGASIVSAMITNASLVVHSMLEGDGFAKKFVQGDWFKLTAYGTNADGSELLGSTELYLANYGPTNDDANFFLNGWVNFDLTSLNGAQRVFFSLTSSDNGQWGMNTPSYFAIDDIQYTNTLATPEPATGTMVILVAATGLGVRWYRRRQRATA